MNSPLTPEQLVNSFTVGNQSEARVETLADGTYVIVWVSNAQDGDQQGIFAQRYSSQGERIGAQVSVNETAIEIQQDPSVAATEDGGFVIVWESRNQDQPGFFDFGIYGQRFAADGSKAGGEFQVNAVNVSATQFDPDVAGVPGGGFAVAFTDDFGDSSNDGVRVRFYDAGGAPIGDDFQVNSEVSSNQGEVSIASVAPSGGSTGGVVVVWTSPASGTAGDGSGQGVFAQIYAPDGTAVGGEFLVNSTTVGSQQDSAVAGLDGGRFVVVWEDNNGADGSGFGIFGQVFDGDGTAVGGEFQINTETSSSQYDPEITATTDGGFVVTWTSSTSGTAGDGSSDGVFTRRFDADGVAVSGEILVNEETSGSQRSSDISALANGDFVSVWTSDTFGTAGDGSGQGVFQRIFGDEDTFAAPSARPQIDAFSLTRTFSETDVNAGPQRLDFDGAVAFSDGDSADLAGGRIVLSSIGQSLSEDGFAAQDANGQLQLGLDATGAVAINGANVSVGGTVVGSISSDGVDGATFVIDLNTAADAAAVEVLLEHLSFGISSDDPRPQTTLELLVEDGDGATSDPVLISVEVTPEADIDGFIGSERQVNTVTVSSQSDSTIAGLSDGGYISVWTSQNQDNSGDNDTGVFAQRYDASGGAVGPEFQVNVTVTSSQFDADVAGLSDGGWVVVWDDDTTSGVRLNRYDASGALVATEVQVETETSSSQFQPQVTGLSNGGYVVTWTSVTSGAAGDGNSNAVIGQLFNAAGARVGGEIAINEQTTGAQDTAAVSALSGGRFVAVWEENDVANGDGSSTSVSARIFDASGSPEGGEFQVNFFTNSTQATPKVATLDNGDFVVVWRSEGQDSSSGGIYYQRYADDGVAIGAETRVNDSVSGDQTFPDIIALDTGGFVIGWTDTSATAPGSGSDVFVQVFDVDGTRLDSETLINTEVSSTQSQIALAALPDGNYVVQWTSITSGTAGDGDSNGIFQQIIGDPAEISQSAAPVLQGLPLIVEIDEDVANAGSQLVLTGGLSLTDADSADLEGGVVRLSRVVTEPLADRFNAPDDLSQDSVFVAVGGVITQAGAMLNVDGVAVAMITSDGLNGADLVLDLLAGATADRVQTLVNALSYQTDSDNPRESRTYSLLIEDGDGGLTQPQSLEIRINQVAEPGAPVPVPPEEQVNSFETGAQDQQEVAALADGGWVVVWESDGQDESGEGVFGQRYNSEGARVGGEFQVSTFASGNQADPVVTALEDGGWVVVWESSFLDVPGVNDTGIIAQRYAADGTPVGGETVVNTSVSFTQFDPAVATIPTGTAGFANGGYVVVYTSDLGDGSSDGILMQRFATDGTPIGAELVVNTTTAGNQGSSDVAVLAGGSIAVTYSSGSTVFVRTFNPDGTEAVGEAQVATGASSSEKDIAATADGGFVIAWTDTSGLDGSGQGIAAQRYDASGAPTGDVFVVNDTFSGTQGEPDVIGLDDGTFVIAWRNFSGNVDASGDGVVAQRFAATGERLDGEFLLNQETFLSSQFSPQLAALPGGNFVATFSSVTSGASGDGSSNGVFQQVFGNPADFTPGAAPVIQGLSETALFEEAEVNAGLQRLDADASVAFGDADSNDFSGGVLTLAVAQIFDDVEQLNAGDDDTQDQLGLVAGDVGNGDVQFSGLSTGDTVTVDGVVVGTITSGGFVFEIALNASATAEVVEALLGNLAYGNTSDAPSAVRRLSVDLTDGDGQSTPTQLIEVTVNPGVDSTLIASDERGVNAHTESNQDTAQVAELAGGGLVVVWQSINQDNLGDFSTGVFGQLYDANGGPTGPEFQVNALVPSAQTVPSVTATADGGFVVAWQSVNQDNPGDFDTGIVAQRFAADGSKQGVEFVANTAVAQSQFAPSIAAFEDGGFVATYVSDNGDGSSDAILSQRFDASGAAVGLEITVNSVTVAGNQSQPDVATLVDAGGSNAGHVVVFTSSTSGTEGDGDRNGVFAQRFDANGAAAGTEFQVNTATIDDQSQPSVIGLGGGGFVVVWTDDVQDGSSGGIFAQRYDVGGGVVGDEFRVNTDRINSESDADVTALSDGGFVVSWTAGSGQDGSSDGVFAQRFAANGDRIDGEIQINEETSSQQFQSAVTSFNDGFASVWSSFTSASAGDGSGYGVSLRTFESAPAANNSPVLGDVERDVQLFADDIVGGAQILDDAIELSDPDSASFNGGSLEVYYTSGMTSNDQLSIATDALVTISGNTISVGGTAVATIDAVQNGANGASLVIDFNAAADVAAVKAITEHLAYGSTDTAGNLQLTNRGIGFTLTDGSGGQSEPDSIYVRIASGASTATGLFLDDFADPENEATQLDDTPARSEADLFNAPQLIDANIDFDDLSGTSFDGGLVQISEVFNSGTGKQISLQNQGTGAGQIGFDGTNASYEGTVIGTVNATSNGVNGAAFAIDLNADATEAGIEALVEALTFGLTGGLTSTNRIGFDLTIRNQAGDQTTFTRMEQELIRDLVLVDTGLATEAQVNTFTTSTQQAPRIADLSDGGYVVVWNSTGQDNPNVGNRGIFAQVFNEQGQQVGVEFQVNDLPFGDQFEPRAEGLSNGTFVLLWNENTSRDGSGQGVFAQLYQNDGTEVGSAFQVNEEFSSTQNQPEAVDLGGGRFMVVWTSQTSGTAGDGSSTGVFGRVFDAAGVPEAGEFQINSTTNSTQQFAQVTVLDNGDTIVVWEDQGGADGASIGVFAQRIDTNGALVSFNGAVAGADEQQVNTTTAGNQSRPDVASLGASATLPNGGFIVVWQSSDASSDGIFGQMYDDSGALVGTEFQVNTSTLSTQSDPVVVGTPDGGFVVAWSDASGVDGSGTGVTAQRFNADGSFNGNAFVVNEEVSSTQNQPDIAVLVNGALATVWASQTSATAGDGSGVGVFQALFDQPVPAAGSISPVLEGVEETVTFDENVVNATAQLLNQDGAMSLVDADSSDLDGGTILVQRIVGSSLNEEQLRGPGEGIAQDVFGVLGGNGVSVAGTQVSVDGTAIGTIIQDGTNGDPLQIALSGASATPEAVEAIIAQLSYQNQSDNPLELRQVAIQVTDGDGGSTGSQVVDIVVNSEVDLTALPQGAEEQVNTFIAGNQSDAATTQIFNAAGVQIGYVVVWTSADQDRVQDASAGIFGQRYDLNGDPVGGEFQVNLHTEFVQSDPTVTGLPTGGFVVGWNDNSFAHPAGVPNGETSTGNFAQIFDENGVRVGDEFLVNDITSTSTQRQLEMAAQSDGTIAAVFTDDGSADGSGSGVFLRLFDDTGTAAGASIQVNQEFSSTQSDGAVSILSGGRIVVTWTSFTSATAGDGSSNGVFARLFEADGTAVGGEFQVNTSTFSNQDAARVAALADGSFVVVWDDDSGADGSSTAIQMQRFDANGVAIDGEVLVNESTSSSQFDPYIVALDTGGWVVAWSDSSGADGSGQGVFGQVYAADGSRIDGEIQLNTEFSSTQGEARLVALPNGGFTAVWTSFTSASAGDGSSNGIFQQVFANAGDVQISENPVLIALEPEVTLDEADVNAGGQLFATAAGLGDVDSPDFEGGVLTVSMVVNDVIQTQFAAPDDGSQDNLGFDTNGVLSISGTTLSVDGTALGTITSDGQNGSELIVQLNASSTKERVEDAIRALTYANVSDDPEASRLVSIQVNDGDGGHVRELVQINITPEIDGAVAVGNEVQTNSFTTNNQSDSAIAGLADGGYVVVWTSTNQDATGDNDLGVFAQRYDASGAPVGGEVQVNTNAAFAQSNADVVGLSTGGFVVSWDDNSGLLGTDNDEEIALQVFDANGQPVGGEIAAPSSTHFDPDAAALAAFDNGDFVLVRNGRNNDSPFIDQIFVQRFNDQGGTVGAESVISPIGSSGATGADVAVQSDGTYVVVYNDMNVDNPGDNDFGVFMQRYAADDSQIGGPVQVNTTERFSQFAPKIAATEDGGYVIVFESDVADDFGFSTSAGIFAQRFDGQGNRVGEEFLVNEVVDNSQSAPGVAAIEGGGFAITYSDNNSTDGSGVGVFLQQYDADANRIDGALQVNQETSSTQNEASVASLPGGNLVVSFTSTTSATAGDGSSNGVFHRIIGDPDDFASGGDPVVEGINREVTYLENTLNGVPQLIDADGAAAVSDPDSSDFDGGSILVSNLISSAPLINQINAPDDLTQDQLGLRQTAQITIAGTAVSVDGTEVAQIIQGGQDGTPFELRLNTNATAEVVELLVENLTYRNISDDPLATRDLRIQVTDGDGGASEPQIVTITITPTPDSAQPVGSEQVVNTTDTGSEDNPEIVTLPGTGGDFIVTWTSFGTDGSREGIFGQRFDVNGNKLARDGTGLASGASDEFQINTTTAQDQASQEVAAFSDGGWIVAWVDDALDGSGSGIVAQLFNPDGTLNGSEFVANDLVSSTQFRPDVAVLDDDTFVITWESINSAGAGDGNGNGIIARHFQADGTPITSQFVVNSETVSTQSDPAVTELNDGGFLITWQSFSSAGSADGAGFGIFAQRYDASAAPVGAEFQVNTATRGDQTDAETTVLSDGNIVVTWTDSVADLSGTGIYATIIAPDGTPLVDEFRVNDQRFTTQNDPVVAALDNGDFVIAWTDHAGTDGSGQGVFAQQYDASGARVDSQFQVNTTVSGSQNQPDIAGLPGGGFVITWNGSVLIQIYGNDAPSISPVSANGDEDTAIVLDAAIFEAGFVDPDGNTLEEIRIETFPVNGALVLNSVPVIAGQVVSRADLLAGNLIYTGNQDFNGLDSFLWTGSDGIAFSQDPPVAANITVDPVNDAPGLDAGADTSVGEGANLNRSLTLTDPDVDSRSFTVDYGDGSPIASFDTSSLAPVLNHVFAGEGTFTVTVTVDDNAGEANSTETDTFEVTVVNANPNAASDFITVSEDGPAVTGNALSNDSDPGGDALTVSAVNGLAADVGQQITLASGALVTLNADGSFDYDPNGQFENLPDFQTTSDQLTYEVSDGEGGTDTATISFAVLGANDDPDAADDAFAANDDNPISGNVLNDNGSGADSDIDVGNFLSVAEVNGQSGDVGNQITLGSGALLTLNVDGTFDYDPNGAFGTGGTDSFDYTVSDGRGGTDTASVTISIDGTNPPPVARDDSIAADEEVTVIGDVLADNGNGADSDAGGDTITVTQVNGSAANVGIAVALAGGGQITLQSTGLFSFEPNNGYETLSVGDTATETFEYTIEDGNGGSDTATVTLSIAGVNDAPVGAADNAATDQDSTATGNVLSNDTDVDVNDVLLVTEVGGSTLAVGVATATSGGGTVTLGSDGQFTYDPGAAFDTLGVGQTATDSINYTVADGNGGSDTATLFIVVSGLNDAPTANDDVLAVGEDNTLFGNLTLDNGNGADSDPDASDIPFVTEVNGEAADIGQQITLASGALLTVNGSGTFSYDTNGQFETLNTGETATDSFTYTLSDGNGGTDTATATVTINGNADAPVAGDDGAATDEDTPVSGAVLANDTDADGDALTVSAVEGEATDVGSQIALASGALLTLNADGTFDYDPNGQFENLSSGQVATDTFDYTVSDGNGGTDTATVSVDVSGVNDAPLANDDFFATNEDTGLTALNLFANNGAGVDMDVDQLDMIMVSEVDGQSANVGSQFQLASGALLTVNADGTAAYDPNGAFEFLSAGGSTADAFTYAISDGNGGTDTATVSINVTGVNDAPEAADDSRGVSVDGLLSGNVLADNGNGADSDPDAGDTLSVTELNGSAAALGVATTLASGARVTLNADGTFDYDQNGSFSGLGTGATATDSFEYAISDGNGGTDTATVTITIGGSNLPPVAIDDSFATNEDSAFTTGSVLTNDSDPNVADALSVVSVDDTGTVGLVTDNGDGTFDYDPNGQFETLGLGQTAVDTFTYTISDGNGGLDTATVNITINGVNDTPVANSDVLAVTEDAQGSVLVTANDTDVDGDDVEITSVNDAATVGSVLIEADNDTVTYSANGQFETLAAGETATDSFTYTISDGNGGSDTATVDVTITGVNDGPVAQDDDLSTDEDTGIIGGSVLADNGNGADSDVDNGAVLSVAAVNGQAGDVGSQVALASGALLTLNADGTFDYNPNGAFEALAVGDTGSDSFEYTLSDENGATDTATVTVSIDGVNDAPVAEDDSFATDEDTGVSGNILGDNGNGADSDVDAGDTRIVSSIIGTTSGAILTVGDDGTFDYDPNGAFEFLAAGASATDSFTYTISDGNGGTDTATVSIEVTGVNDAPVAEDDSRGVTVGAALVGNVLVDNGNGADSDPDAGDVLSVTALNGVAAALGVATTLASGAIVTLNADGTFDYDQNGSFAGLAVGTTATDTFEYTISDGNGGTDTAIVTLTISSGDTDIATDDTFDIDEGQLDPSSGKLLRLGALNNDTDLLENDIGAQNIISVNGQPLEPGVLFAGDNGGQFRVYEFGVVDFQNWGDPAAAGTSTGFSYTVSDGNGGTDTARVTLNIGPDIATDDTFDISEGQLDPSSGKLLRLGALNNDTDLLENDIGAQNIISVNGQPLEPGVLFAGDNGGQFRVYEFGVVDFQNWGDPAAAGTSTGFSYTVSDGNGGTDTARVTLNIGPDIATDDTFVITEDQLDPSSGKLLRLGALNDDTDLLENDLGADEIVFVNDQPIQPGILFEGDNGGQFRVYKFGVVDFQNWGNPADVGTTTGFTYAVSDGNGGMDTARVTLEIGAALPGNDENYGAGSATLATSPPVITFADEFDFM